MYARTEDAPWVLYDLERDPYEQHNRADDPAFAEQRERLDERLDAWMRSTGDSWSLNSMEPVEDKGRLYRFETFYTIEQYQKWADEHPDQAVKK